MTLEDIAAEVEADVLAEERKAVDAVSRIVALKDEIRTKQDELKTLEGPVRRWFQLHAGEVELPDPETGYRAYMQSGGEELHYADAWEIKERDPNLYVSLEALRCLAVDAGAVKEQVKKGYLIQRYLAPFERHGERTPSLRTGPIKK